LRFLVDDVSHLVDDPVSSALVRAGVHVAVAFVHDMGVVMGADRDLVAAEADGDALVAAVHGDEVDVDVDEEVALDGAAVEADAVAVGGLGRRTSSPVGSSASWL
jgi:hypothetical protein